MRTSRVLVVLLILEPGRLRRRAGGTRPGPGRRAGRSAAAGGPRGGGARRRASPRRRRASRSARSRRPGGPCATRQIGSSNVATADPPVPRPGTAPCVVPLFSGLTFADFSPKPYQFAPPAGCPGPWAKVVLEADFSVTAGRQFDRTATIGLGGATIYLRHHRRAVAHAGAELARRARPDRSERALRQAAERPDLDRQRRQRHLHRRAGRQRQARLLSRRRALSGAARGRRRRPAGRRQRQSRSACRPAPTRWAPRSSRRPTSSAPTST